MAGEKLFPHIGKQSNRMGGSWKGSGIEGLTALVDGTAVIIEMFGAPVPCTVWTVPAAGDTVTVSYSTDNEANYDVIAVTAAAKWEGRLESGITHLKFQRTAGTGVTSTYGVC